MEGKAFPYGGSPMLDKAQLEDEYNDLMEEYSDCGDQYERCRCAFRMDAIIHQMREMPPHDHHQSAC